MFETISSDYKCIISWICAYDPGTTDKLSEYLGKSEPRPKQSRQIRSKIKVMLIIFFDNCGVVCYELFPPSQTVKPEFELGLLVVY